MPEYFCKIDTDYPRLDRYISEVLNLLSRSQIKARKLKAQINGKDVKLSRNVEQGDNLKLFWEDEPPENIIPEDLPLNIIYEDDKCVVINKAQGMVVHPGAGNKQGTLANAIFYRILNKKNISELSNNNLLPTPYPLLPIPYSLRPGIVHRLDKDTSGVIIAAYNEETHAFLAEQFKSRKVKKTYIAIVRGVPKELKGRIETFIARDPKDRKKFTVNGLSANPKSAASKVRGKKALTFYKVLKTRNSYSLVLLRPKTGRTHQLRAHMRHIGCPILGDSIYGVQDKNYPNVTLMLHAKRLEITLMGEEHPIIFSTPVPERFKNIFPALNRTSSKLS